MRLLLEVTYIVVVGARATDEAAASCALALLPSSRGTAIFVVACVLVRLDRL